MTTDDDIIIKHESSWGMNNHWGNGNDRKMILELMALARQDERNTLRNGIESGYTCVKAGCKGEAAACVECINKELEKARQDTARRIFAELETKHPKLCNADQFLCSFCIGEDAIECMVLAGMKKKFGVDG